MCGNSADTFQLSCKTKEVLLKLSTSHSLPVPLVLRSKVILLASEGKSNPQISAETRIAYTTVSTWRTRFYNNAELIARAEQCSAQDGSSLELENVILSILSDKQPEEEPVLTQKQLRLINELACKKPKDFGWRLRRWNPPALAAEAARQGIVETISPGSFQGLLKPSAAAP